VSSGNIVHGIEDYEILGIRPLLIDKLISILIPQAGAIAPEGFVVLSILDPFINRRINYQYDDQLPI
jgi:hypothetical protein